MDITLRGIKFTCDVKHGSECMRVTLGTKLIINGGLIKAASEHTGLGIKLEEGSTLNITNVHLNKFQSSVINVHNVPNVCRQE